MGEVLLPLHSVTKLLLEFDPDCSKAILETIKKVLDGPLVPQLMCKLGNGAAPVGEAHRESGSGNEGIPCVLCAGLVDAELGTGSDSCCGIKPVIFCLVSPLTGVLGAEVHRTDSMLVFY